MATQLSIFKSAALILREPATTLTVSDDSVLVNTMNVEWADVRALILESGKWNFAARTLSIEAESDVTSEFGPAFAFQKPEDYKNLIAISANAYLFPPFGPNEYRDEGNYWFANCDPIYVSIVSDGAEYGGDLSLWPSVVARAAAYELAYRIAPHVTSNGGQDMQELERRRDKAMRRAKSWDASKQPPESFPPPRLAVARGGRWSSSRNWRNW